MGSFDFTYELPNNFDKRTQQFLQQMNAFDVANAFVNMSMMMLDWHIMLD